MIGRRGWVGAVLAAVLAVVVALPATIADAAPTGINPPPDFDGGMAKRSITVSGSYTPLVGNFDCDDDPTDYPSEHLPEGEEIGILWYAPGPGGDSLWTDIELDGPGVTYTSTPLSITGSYQPLVGDFDGDYCDDVFWYAAGTAPDFVWWGGPDGFTSSAPLQVTGSYRPVVGPFGGREGRSFDGIYWYAPHGPETLWLPTGDRAGPFRSVAAPQVGGTGYQPVWFWYSWTGTPMILWYTPGTGADHLWGYGFGVNGITHVSTTQLSINGKYRPAGCSSSVLLHGPGPALDQAGSRNGDMQWDPMTIPGTYRVAGNAGWDPCGAVVWHGPGSAPDQIWLRPGHQ